MDISEGEPSLSSCRLSFDISLGPFLCLTVNCQRSTVNLLFSHSPVTSELRVRLEHGFLELIGRCQQGGRTERPQR